MAKEKTMAIYQNEKALNKLTLGKTTQYCSEYNPELLQAVPRNLNRDDLALTSTNLPFIGEDVWYGYELSWLNTKGKPVVAVAEFRFSCVSPNIVESKSFKLYLNSYNQSKFANKEVVIALLIKDLSATAGTVASVKLFDVENCPALAIRSATEQDTAPDTELNTKTIICIDNEELSIDNYQLSAQLLSGAQQMSDNTTIIQESLVSHLLKSNCLITNQPDWASIFIDYKGKPINHAALLKYLISFRQHNEFHEQCVERIFCDLKKYCQLDQLTVFARYTRRGGLDINPFRSTHLSSAPYGRTLRQ